MRTNAQFEKEVKVAAVEAVGNILAAVAAARGTSNREVDSQVWETLDWLKKIVTTD